MNNISNLRIGANYLVVDKGIAVAYIFTKELDRFLEEDKPFSVKTFLQEISQAYFERNVIIGQKYYLIPFITLPFNEKYQSGAPLDSKNITIEAAVVDEDGFAIFEWGPFPFFPEETTISYQTFAMGKALEMLLDDKNPVGDYTLVVKVTDKATDKKAEFKHPFLLQLSPNG